MGLGLGLGLGSASPNSNPNPNLNPNPSPSPSPNSSPNPNPDPNQYLGHCPRVSFPGRTFPVTAVYLEHAIALCRHRVDTSAEWCRGSQAK